MAPKNYQQRQQAAAAPKPDRSNHSSNKPNKPTNAPKKKPTKAPAPTTPPTDNQEGAGYYDPGNVGPGNGDFYDPNSGYGRTPTNTTAASFDQWLSDNGYGTKQSLGKNQKKRLQGQYQQYAGAPPNPDSATGDWYGTGEGEHAAGEDHAAYANWLLGEAGALSGNVPLSGSGATQFGQWLDNTYFPGLEQGYDAANGQSGNQLTYQDYLKTQGWGPGGSGSFDTASTSFGPPPANRVGMGTMQTTASTDPALAATKPFQPLDTGNPFTSTSMAPSAQAVTPNPPDFPATPGSFGDYRQDQGIGQHQWKGMNDKRKGRIKNAFTGGQDTNAGTITPPDPTAAATPPVAGNTGVENARQMFAALTPQQRGINTATSNRPTRWSVF